MDYLNGRTFFTSCGLKRSSAAAIYNGVPQGSVLGPLLFCLFINDLPNALSYTRNLIYADDTTIYHSSSQQRQLILEMQHDFDSLKQWFECNNLIINETKTQLVIFGTKQKLRDINENYCQLHINDYFIKRSHEAKYLGVILDECMSWTPHVKLVATKVSRALGRLSSVKHLIPRKARKMVYSALIYPHLNYCSNSWSSTADGNISFLHRSLNRCCRSVLNIKDIRSSTVQMYKTLSWLPVGELLRYNVLVEMFRCINGLNKYSINFPRLHSDVHDYPTRQNGNFVLPNFNLTTLNKAFFVKGPLAWNNLNDSIKESSTLATFKRKLKKFLLDDLV